MERALYCLASQGAHETMARTAAAFVAETFKVGLAPRAFP